MRSRIKIVYNNVFEFAFLQYAKYTTLFSCRLPFVLLLKSKGRHGERKTIVALDCAVRLSCIDLELMIS